MCDDVRAQADRTLRWQELTVPYSSSQLARCENGYMQGPIPDASPPQYVKPSQPTNEKKTSCHQIPKPKILSQRRPKSKPPNSETPSWQQTLQEKSLVEKSYASWGVRLHPLCNPRRGGLFSFGRGAVYLWGANSTWRRS